MNYLRQGRSIRFRLTAWYAAILASTFLALGIGIWAAIHKRVDDALNSDLRSRVERMSRFLKTFNGNEHDIAEEMNEQTAMTSMGTAVRLEGKGGNWIYRSPGSEGWNASLGPDGIETSSVGGKQFRVITAAVSVGRLQIGVPYDAYERVLDSIGWAMVFATPLALAFASVGGYWMSGRALEPVDEIANIAREISAHRLSDRLPIRNTGDELDRLSETLNDMFERLEAAFRRMTQFTADASHELRTPVAIIRTTAEIATSRPRSTEAHLEAWRRVISESERTSSLLDDLMLLARGDAGAGAPKMAPINFSACANDACDGVRPLVESAQLQLVADIEQNISILGDPEGLRRLCLILLDNAVKYTPQGGRISLRLHAVDGRAVLEVADSGIGIAEEHHRHIFDRFYRVSKDRSRTSGGAGLGLAIAQWIAARHGSKIEVSSSLGLGSTFRIVLSRFAASSESLEKISEKVHSC